ncbi:MAG: hypothetical protein DI632_09950, partial [Sphingomonas hengshuiensis]
MQDDQAIFVTHHGRATHVLTTVRHYTDLQDANGGRRSDAGLAPLLGLRPEHGGSVAGMLARLPATA